jgi:hypothetical protein
MSAWDLHKAWPEAEFKVILLIVPYFPESFFQLDKLLFDIRLLLLPCTILLVPEAMTTTGICLEILLDKIY